MMLKHTSRGLVVVLLAGVVGTHAQSASQSSRAATRTPMGCADLTGLVLDGSTSITSATLVASGTLVAAANLTLTNLPPFCRVQGLSKPSTDSIIVFEVWLPQPANWNARFLSSGEGGFAGTLNYTRNGLDGGMDELLRRGYATAATDTGHLAADRWWAVGHPEKAVDYLYRAKHVVTVAAKPGISTGCSWCQA
jgi:feruloyl esterase